MNILKSFPVFFILLFAVLCSCQTANDKSYIELAHNQILNPSFEEPGGWEDLWLRDQGMGKLGKVSLSYSGDWAMQVDHWGSEDWAFGQNRRIPVTPGEVYEFTGMVKFLQGNGSVELSVVPRDSDGQVLSWLFGILSLSGVQEWTKITSKIIIPRDCSSIQLRVTGRGAAVALVDDLTLIKLKDSPEPLVLPDEEVTLTAGDLSLTFMPDTGNISIGHAQLKDPYIIKGFGDSASLKDFQIHENRFRAVFLTTGEDVILDLSMEADGTILCEISGRGEMAQEFSAPGYFQSQPFQSWVIPYNEGLLVPAGDTYYNPWNLRLFQGHGGLSMPFLGLTDGNEGIMILSETPDDCLLKYKKPEENASGGSSFGFYWLPQIGQWGYTRSLRIYIIKEGGYNGMAKVYRDLRRNQGGLVTLREKAERVPAVDKLIGAADVWWWIKASEWSNEEDIKPAAEELKAAGMDRVLWSNSQGGQNISFLNEMGYISSIYDIYQDVWASDVPIAYGNRTGWPEDLVLLPDGSYMKGWVAKEKGKEYPGGVICSIPGLEQMKQKVSQEMENLPYLSRFYDTTTASPLRECYHPDHPQSRSSDRLFKSKLFQFSSDELHLITGSETGIDWAVPYLHYFEGMMSLADFRLPNSGYDLVSYRNPTEEFRRFQMGYSYRIPLFELVYHDCVVSYWYWGDSSNRLPEYWRDRDLFNLLYGTGPLYIMDREKWSEDRDRFMESYRVATLSARKTGYDEMLEHRFLNQEGSLQYSCFSNGVEVWVNFSEVPQSLPDGRILQGKDYILSPDALK